ncbi:thioether cross-link-forming SCIFF peptide maturase [Scatolibacter rhodanostii]|uniref:thioether cross-link-forming SCIFF peptide maturase n=1 Tax=Scatolibacter rhodanostii TaxID=2014781 RepID=UPI000C076DCB|nr:thioether cross-link-forming SCIFF peptide maturase [Scatolibacter rhodanostii]
MVHQYKKNGYNIIMDVNSGAVHVVDDLAYDVIARYETADKQQIVTELLKKYADVPEITETEILDSIADVEELKEGGDLFSEDTFRQHAGELKKRLSTLKAICLNVAHDCNLRCKYCFADEGEYRGKREIMSLEVGKKAFDFLVENSGTRRNLEVDFFGGEPLMNFKVVKELTEYAKEIKQKTGKNIRLTLTTNGMLLNDEVIEFANREMENVVLSLDGRKEVNDKMRPTANGKGSYEIIVPKFKKLVESRNGKTYYIRGTFTNHNLDFAKDILHYADLGFKELSIEPVVCDPSEEYAIHKGDLPTILEQYDILADEMLKREEEGKGFLFYHYMIDLKHGPCIAKLVSGCGVGLEYLAITPNGDIYPCHQFVGEDEFRLGNVETGIERTDIQDKFRGSHLYEKEECANCFAKFYCSGGCAANAYHAHGNINGIYEIGCEMQRRRVENAVMMEVHRAMREAE